MEIDFVGIRRFFYFLSVSLLVLSLVFLKIFGIRLSIDLRGGVSWVLEGGNEVLANEVEKILKEQGIKNFLLQKVGEREIIIKAEEIEKKDEILKTFQEKFQLKEKEFEKISPTIGKELKRKTIFLVVFSLLLMFLYIGIAFSKMPKPFQNWKIGAIVTFLLFHDILILFGFFSILSKFFLAELSIPIIISFLTVIGYGINNFIVVFDRLRELVLKIKKEKIEKILNLAVSQTLERQINTSFAVIICLFFIFLFSPPLKWFSLILILGTLVSLYSSVFLAVPLTYSFLKK